jgi:serine/threonine protein kinase
MARLAHPNLAAIFGLETWQGVPMLIVEFLAGGTLADRLRRGPLSAREAIDLGRALAAGLASMHAVGLLHRDIKPNNIGFQTDGTPKLLDFGLAQLLSESGSFGPSSTSAAPDQRTSSLDRMGTPAYAPPARYRLEVDDPVRDLWSLSLVLYEAIAGTNPLLVPHADGQASTSERQRNIPSVLQHAPACPPEVAAFLAHALSANAAERPRTARAFMAALIELDRLLP